MPLDPWLARVRAASINEWISPDGSGAAGRCLEFVNWCYGNPTSRMGDLGPLPGGAENGNWQDAKQGWYGSAHKHPGDGTDAPGGVPIFWETGPSGNKAGHITVSDGLDAFGIHWTYTTDYKFPRSVHRMRTAELNRLRGRALGWTEDYGGNPIAGMSGPPASAPIEEDDMFDTNDRDKLAGLETKLDKLSKETAMFMLSINDGEGRFGGGTIYALTGPGYWLEIRTVEAANVLAGKYGNKDGNSANVTYDEWAQAKAAALGSSPAHA